MKVDYMKRIAAFIDFQGTIGGEGTDDIRSLILYDFSAEAIKMLNDKHILTIGITNQSHISKGKLSMDDYTYQLERISSELAKRKARFDDVFCCPHSHKDNCSCKKPLPGMVNMAKDKYDISVNKSYVIGDMGKSDMVLAKNVGAKGVLVLTGVGKDSLGEYRHTWAGVEADHIADNLLEAVKWIIADYNYAK